VEEGYKPADHPIQIEATVDREVVVGREDPSSAADYHLSAKDRRVSRQHFRLRLSPPDQVFLEDCGSINGTYLRREDEAEWARVTKARLQEGDEIRVGRTILGVEILPAPAEKAREGTRKETWTLTCIGCDKPLPPMTVLGTGDYYLNVMDFLCPRCREEREEARRRAIEAAAGRRYTCKDCGRDLTRQAASDGRAAELADLVSYWCRKCAERQRELKGRVGRYWVVKELGEGGMGTVYQAWDEATGRVVALKCLLGQVVDDPRMVSRFQREMLITGALIHPNLVRLIETGRVGDRIYLISEFVRGGNLWQRVQERGPLPIEEAANYILQILDGLAFIHRLEYVHRDIKPQNILLQPRRGRMVAKLADFGLARSYTRHGWTVTRDGEFQGTLPFIPPEQIADFKHCRPPVDIYALGVSLYYLLTGALSLPFASLNILPGEGEKVVLEGEPIPILQRRPDLPEELAQVVDRAVQKRPEDRYPTAEAFRATLEQALAAIEVLCQERYIG